MRTQKDFSSKSEFLKYIISNKEEIMRFKKLQFKKADPFDLDIEQDSVIKTLNTSHKDDVANGIITRSVIGNTYNWLDSHDDVHIDNCFSKSISESQSKILHLHDHEHKITAKVGKPKSIYEKSVAWKDLGINIEGKTTALFMDSNIMKEYNAVVFAQYLDKQINQHSVGMQYVQLSLAVNDADSKAEFAEWQKYIDRIGNKEKAIEQGFFWAVKEAKLIEISCVLSGSNELTPTVDNEKQEVIIVEESFFSRLTKHIVSN